MMPRARSWSLTIAARARSGSACGPAMRARIRRTRPCRSAPGQDGEGAVDGAAEGATGDADAGVEAAGEPLAAAGDDGPAEVEAAGLSIGVGAGGGVGGGGGAG